MIKIIGMIREVTEEARYALKELREAIAALEALLASPDFGNVEKFRKELIDVVDSLKVKGR